MTSNIRIAIHNETRLVSLQTPVIYTEHCVYMCVSKLRHGQFKAFCCLYEYLYYL